MSAPASLSSRVARIAWRLVTMVDVVQETSSPRVFVCGPTPLVESVASALVELGHEPALVKTERFGPTG